MSVSNAAVKHVYDGNASQTTFAIPFDFIKNNSSEVAVYVVDSDGVETLKALGADYTLTPAYDPGDPTAGPNNVEMDVAPAADEKLLVIRITPYLQELEIDSGPLLFDSIEKGLDQLLRQIQQVAEKLKRTLKFRQSSDSSVEDLQIPDLVDAERVLGFNADNEPVLYSADDLMNIAGALVRSQNLADLLDPVLAVKNLGIAPYSYPTSHAVTLSQAATNLTGETFDGATYLAIVFEFMIIQSTTVFATGCFSLHYRNSTWELVMGETREADLSTANGVVFSVTQASTTAQLQAAESGVGNATVMLKKSYFFTNP